MTLLYVDQVSTADDTTFIHRVEAACFTAAVWAVNQSTLADPTVQFKRVSMANTIIKAPEMNPWINTFIWFIVSRPQLNVIGDLTDDFINAVCQQGFDPIANQVISVTITLNP